MLLKCFTSRNSLLTLKKYLYSKKVIISRNKKKENSRFQSKNIKFEKRNSRHEVNISDYSNSYRKDKRIDKNVKKKEEREKNSLNTIINNPDTPMRISENDIHVALGKTGNLPENEFKAIIDNYHSTKGNNFINEKLYFIGEVRKKILPNLKLYLNKSLTEILKLTMKQENIDLFEKFDDFWMKLEEEVLQRTEHITNEQIIIMVEAFSKCSLPCDKLFEEFEDVITESELPFNHYQYEKILSSYLRKKKGSTPMIKLISKQFMLNKSLIDSWQLAKFVSILHSHPSSIKGDFGLLSELEIMIQRDIKRNTIKFDDLIKLSNYLFSDNLGSNDIQSKIENMIIKKIKDRIKIEMSRFIKLVENIAKYKIKNKEFCDCMINYLIENLNFNNKLNDATSSEPNNLNNDNDKEPNEEEINNENEEILENGPEILKEEVLNVVRANNYSKLIKNLNKIIWSLTKNEKFKELINKEPTYQHLIVELQNKFLENIDIYKDRDLIISLDSFTSINKMFYQQLEPLQKDKLINRIKNVNNSSPHDLMKLLKVIIHSNIENDVGILNEVFNKISAIYDSFFYKDLISFSEIIQEFSYMFEDNFKIEFSKLYEKKIMKILKDVEISDFCRIIKSLSYIFKWSDLYIENIKLYLKSRLNEIPKQYFLEVFYIAINMKLYEIDVLMFDILNELSSFQNIHDYFNSPSDKLNLYWCCLNIYQTTNDMKIKNSALKILDYDDEKEFVYEKNNLINRLFSIKIDELNGKFDEELNKYIQCFYLFLLILKQKNKPNYEDIVYDFNKNVSSRLIKISLDLREKYISEDPACKYNKDVFKDIGENLETLFKFKQNASIYQNLLDDFFNPIHYAIVFELPELKKNEKISSEIDKKKFAVLIINHKFKDFKNSFLMIYENRIRILKEIFDWEIIDIQEETWQKLNRDEKQDILKLKFGLNHKSLDDGKLLIEEEVKSKIEESKTKNPKYNLTKDIFNKRNKI